MKIIGYTAGMGCGKSTAIELLSYNQGVEVILVKFAQPLYDIQEFVYDRISPVYARPKDFVKDRKLLQWLGTEFGRSIDENLWVNLWKLQVEAYLDYNPKAIIVCDDVRFDNEAQAIKDMGGKVIRIVSSKAHLRIDTSSGIANHKSEAGISDKLLSAQVPNDGTIEEFSQNLNTVYQILGIL